MLRVPAGVLARVDPGAPVDPPDPPQIALGFDTGLRRIFVKKSGNNSNSGLSENSPKLTIQAALNIVQPGDIITVGDGVYRESFPITLSNFAGTASLPLWIVAENRGQARVSNLWAEADNGTVTWNSDSDDVYFASRSSRPYIGAHDDTFLMAYKNEPDLRAATITAPSAIASGANRTISKPDYGFAFVSGENRVYVRLRDRSNPNGQSVKLNANFQQTIFDFNNADNVILDGFLIEGGGDGTAVNFDGNCANPTVRNCIFTHCRHGVRQPNNTLIEWCEYKYTGFGTWARDLFALDGISDHGVFVLLKGYYNAQFLGGDFFNALLEGSIDFARDISPVPTGNEVRFCLIGPAFDGSRLGNSNFSSVHDCVIQECFDDGLNFDGLSGHPSNGNECHDNLFRDCYRDVSFQASEMAGSGFVYRNVFQHTDNDLAIRGASQKTISTPTAWSGFIYHNTWRMVFDPALSANLRVWDDFSGATPERILNFYNNIVMLSDDLSGSHSSEKPQSIQSNAVVGTSSGNVSVLTGGGGAFAGTDEADMELDAALVPGGTSPAIGIGRALVSGNPDSRSGAGVNDDAGAFVSGETPVSPWPRAATTTFDTSLPSRWTSPGA